MTASLRRAGVLRDAQVIGIERKRVGQGMLGDSIRFALTYDREEEEAPASVVGKFASEDPVSRATGIGVGLYLKEVRFYQELASTVAIRTPRAYVAEIEPESCDFTLLLEDMGPARGGDQVAGCGLADARTAMLAAAALHGPRWGDAGLQALDWMRGPEGAGAAIREGFGECLRLFRGRYEAVLEPEVMAVCHALGDHLEGFLAAGAEAPQTVQHVDFRLDNMLFEPQAGAAGALAMLDWQSVRAGAGVLDVAYFIGAGLSAEDRRTHERDLLDLWLEALRAYGVEGYSREQAWRDYRVLLLQGVFTAVFASVGTKRTPRGDQMFLAMARRHAQHALDLGSLQLLAG